MKSWASYGLVILGLVGYNLITSADRDESGAIIDAGNVDVFQIRVGDCFDDASGATEISSLPGVPCSEPHDNEAYASFNLTVSEYTGDDSMFDLAFEQCLERFEPFVGRDYDSSALDIYTLYPTYESWQQNDREVVCAVFDMDSNKLVGSVRGRGL
ncbi:MAG: septum formation family protein [Woeseiaceae bacterium]|nr:septum formation family protein [Woeseiaceae bacterium]